MHTRYRYIRMVSGCNKKRSGYYLEIELVLKKMLQCILLGMKIGSKFLRGD